MYISANHFDLCKWEKTASFNDLDFAMWGLNHVPVLYYHAYRYDRLTDINCMMFDTMSLVITISFTQYLVLFHSSEIWYYASYQILTKCNLRAYLILFIATFDSMKSAIDRYNKSKMEHHHLVNPTSEVKVYSQQLFSNFCFLCMYTAQPVSDCSTIMDLCFKKIYAIITSGGRLMCYSFVKYRNLKC